MKENDEKILGEFFGISSRSLIFNLLRWNGVPDTSRIFYSKIVIFSQFPVYLSKTK